MHYLLFSLLPFVLSLWLPSFVPSFLSFARPSFLAWLLALGMCAPLSLRSWLHHRLIFLLQHSQSASLSSFPSCFLVSPLLSFLLSFVCSFFLSCAHSIPPTRLPHAPLLPAKPPPPPPPRPANNKYKKTESQPTEVPTNRKSEGVVTTLVNVRS